MKQFTIIGHFQSAPDQPHCFHVEAVDIPSAIRAGEQAAANETGEPISPVDPFVNTFVIAGHVEVLSSWAG